MLGAYFQAREIYSSDLDDYIVEHALCVQDIGPWKAGDVLDVLCMDYTTGKLTEYDGLGDEVTSVTLKLEVA